MDLLSNQDATQIVYNWIAQIGYIKQNSKK